MNEIQRTFAFVAAAGLSLVVALFAAPSAPKPPTEFNLVGEPFYEDFQDPEEAKSLQVIAYDASKAEARLFGVDYQDGLWRIPSRHNYPADGKDRLAKCASSMLGLKREALAGQRANEHPDFEVVDPLDEKAESLKRGQRITLRDAGGKVLADYIIGKEVPSRAGYYYIRRPDESTTYIAKVELDLSTKFTDWIEPDLLKLDGFRLTGIEIDNYSIDYDREMIVSRDESKLTRAKSSDPWKLEGLDESKDEVNQDEVRKLVDGLDNMKIVGVRPKPTRLSRDLKLGEGLKLDMAVSADLGTKGFMFARSESGGSRLVSKEGELLAKTDEGVVYSLNFGEVFSGTEEEIEFGFTKDTSDENSDGQKNDESEGKPKESSEEGLTKSRYLFVTVHLDDNLIPNKPTEPTKPEEPEKPADLPELPSDGAADALLTYNAGPHSDYLRKKAEYETAASGYESAKSKYESDLKTFQTKVEEGEKKVKELNARFADWYYVISAGSFENLRQGRENLIKPKAATTAGDDASNSPGGLELPKP